MYYCIPYYNDSFIVPFLAEYIVDELKDAQYYALLSDKAPTERAKKILLGFSQDELNHAENFMKVYYTFTGTPFEPPMMVVPAIPEYEEALKVRLLEETDAYKEYGQKYLQVKNPYLKELFYMARTDEAIHAMRMHFLMEEELEDD